MYVEECIEPSRLLIQGMNDKLYILFDLCSLGGLQKFYGWMIWYEVKLSYGRVDLSIVMPGIAKIWSCQKFGA